MNKHSSKHQWQKTFRKFSFFHPFTCLSCFIRASALFPASSFLFFLRALGPRSPVALLVRFGFCTGALFVIDCKSCERVDKINEKLLLHKQQNDEGKNNEYTLKNNIPPYYVESLVVFVPAVLISC